MINYNGMKVVIEDEGDSSLKAGQIVTQENYR
jgi:hypothetical protein